MPKQTISLKRQADFWQAGFTAMAGSCEVLVEVEDAVVANQVAQAVAAEAWRIENKFSRYRDDNVIHAIHSAAGAAVEVDAETAQLLDYAAQCYALSEGLFDITSGVLRRVWTFDGSDQLPTTQQVGEVMSLVGWEKLTWAAPQLQLPKGMQIDFGGIGKEYAVDTALQKAQAITSSPVLVNFGGDLAVSGPRSGGRAWQVGIESAQTASAAQGLVRISQGALATSGDARRYLLKEGKRYSHVLDPRTGWPVEHAPRSVTVAAPSCSMAGLMSTLAMLQGEEAEAFLQMQALTYWVQN